MPKGNTTCNDFAKFIAYGTAMPAYGSTWEIHLHTADPGDGGLGTTNETNYTGYAPVVVARDNGQWTICDADGTVNAAGRAFKNIVENTFPECTGVADDQLITFVSLTAAASDQIIYKAALPVEKQIRVTNLTTPRIPVGAAIFKER